MSSAGRPLAIHLSEVRVEVHCREEVAVRALAAAWAPAAEPVVPVARTVALEIRGDAREVWFDGEHLGDALEAVHIAPVVDRVLHERLLDWHEAPRAIFHAASVVLGGRVLVLAGPSDSGKSTLARHLIARGATYFTDEETVFDGARIWGIGRTPQLNEIVPGTPLPERYAGFDVDTESYRFETAKGLRAVPLLRLEPGQVARTAMPVEVAQVVLVRHSDRTRLRTPSRSEALGQLLDERRLDVRGGLGPLFAAAPVCLDWADPADAAKLLEQQGY